MTVSATSIAIADGGGGGDWHDTVVYEFDLVSGGAADPVVVKNDLGYVTGARAPRRRADDVSGIFGQGQKPSPAPHDR